MPTIDPNTSVFGNAWVSGNASVSDTASVFGNASVSDTASVFGNASVSGNAWVQAGFIDADACIGSSSDLCQIIHDKCVWSRFPQADGTYRTTQTLDVTAPDWLTAALNAWQTAHKEADRG
jgi:hypothetical protein